MDSIKKRFSICLTMAGKLFAAAIIVCAPFIWALPIISSLKPIDGDALANRSCQNACCVGKASCCCQHKTNAIARPNDAIPTNKIAAQNLVNACPCGNVATIYFFHRFYQAILIDCLIKPPPASLIAANSSDQKAPSVFWRNQSQPRSPPIDQIN
jgi:hypothetical protein